MSDVYGIRNAGFKSGCKLRIRRIHLDSGGYVRQGQPGGCHGQYYGVGAPLYMVDDEPNDTTDIIGEVVIRAADRDDVKRQLREIDPTFRF
jgi:hypothetical protein